MRNVDSDSSMDSPSATLLVFEDARRPLMPSWQVACFTINVIMGSGFLGVPTGFVHAGVLLGMLTLIGVTFMQWAAACILLQVISRAHALLMAKEAEATLTPTLVPFAKLMPTGGNVGERHGSIPPPSLVVPSHTSYELMMLCRLHLGRWAERLVMVLVSLYMFGSLWSYISVFASSLAATVPLPWLQAGEPCDIYQTETYGGGCITLYYWWVLSFAALMGALLAFDVREQARQQVDVCGIQSFLSIPTSSPSSQTDPHRTLIPAHVHPVLTPSSLNWIPAQTVHHPTQAAFQCAMTAARAVIILLMVGSLLFGSREDFGLPPAPPTPLPWVRWSGLPTMVPIGVFCRESAALERPQTHPPSTHPPENASMPPMYHLHPIPIPPPSHPHPHPHLKPIPCPTPTPILISHLVPTPISSPLHSHPVRISSASSWAL